MTDGGQIEDEKKLLFLLYIHSLFYHSLLTFSAFLHLLLCILSPSQLTLLLQLFSLSLLTRPPLPSCFLCSILLSSHPFPPLPSVHFSCDSSLLITTPPDSSHPISFHLSSPLHSFSLHLSLQIMTSLAGGFILYPD